MKQWMLLAGAAALAFAGPAMAKPGHGNGGYGHGKGHGYDYGERGYGVGGCPPGLAKKGCMPPGQAKKLYRGERYPGYGTLYGYRRIPYSIRTRYALRPYDRYYYYDGYLSGEPADDADRAGDQRAAALKLVTQLSPRRL